MNVRARGDIASHLFQLLGVGELLRRLLHPQSELLLEQRVQLRLQLSAGFRGDSF
jgi:hypothetical protein